MNNLEENKQIAFFVVNFVSKMYHLDDGVLVEFHPASEFPNPKVTVSVTRDYRIKQIIKTLVDFRACVGFCFESRLVIGVRNLKKREPFLLLKVCERKINECELV